MLMTSEPSVPLRFLALKVEKILEIRRRADVSRP